MRYSIIRIQNHYADVMRNQGGYVAMYSSIKALFRKKFAPLGINITDEELDLGNKMNIPTREWKLRWIVQKNEKGSYIEYYGVHNKNEHLHGRIYDNGIEESLDVLKQYIAYSPNIPGDREKSAQAQERHNKTLMKDLKQKGLI